MDIHEEITMIDGLVKYYQGLLKELHRKVSGGLNNKEDKQAIINNLIKIQDLLPDELIDLDCFVIHDDESMKRMKGIIRSREGIPGARIRVDSKTNEVVSVKFTTMEEFDAAIKQREEMLEKVLKI